MYIYISYIYTPYLHIYMAYFAICCHILPYVAICCHIVIYRNMIVIYWSILSYCHWIITVQWRCNDADVLEKQLPSTCCPDSASRTPTLSVRSSPNSGRPFAFAVQIVVRKHLLKDMLLFNMTLHDVASCHISDVHFNANAKHTICSVNISFKFLAPRRSTVEGKWWSQLRLHHWSLCLCLERFFI
jgi:hypothetical protein